MAANEQNKLKFSIVKVLTKSNDFIYFKASKTFLKSNLTYTSYTIAGTARQETFIFQEEFGVFSYRTCIGRHLSSKNCYSGIPHKEQRCPSLSIPIIYVDVCKSRNKL